MSDGLKLISAIVATGSGTTLARLEPELFTDVERNAFEFVRDFHRQYREIPDAATVQQETGTRLPTANETLEYYVDSVKDRFTFNAVRDRYAEMRDALSVRDIDAMRPLVQEMQQALNARRERGQTVMNVGDAIGLSVQRLEDTRGFSGITGIETPWDTFNEITGGYQNADLVTVVGRPGTSKTYNLLTQALAAHQAGNSTLVVTTEMGIEQLARRIISLRLGINPDALKRNTVSTYMERRIRALQAEMLEYQNFKIFSVGMGAKISAIEGLIQEFGPAVVYLDGTYLIHPSVSQPMKRIERVGEVFDQLKGLTIDADIPIINTMQFNRQAGKDGKDGSLENIGFTDAVGMHSSIVVGLKFGPTENPRHSRTMEFLKGREGETGQVHLNFKFAPVDMSELDPALIVGEDGEPLNRAPGAGGGNVDVDWMT